MKTEGEGSTTTIEFVLEYRDVPSLEWGWYDTFPTLKDAQARLADLVKRGLRPQGVDFRIAQVIMIRARIVVESRPFGAPVS